MPAHSVVVQQERPAEQFFLLAKGHARYFFITEEGRKIVLTWLLPGDVFRAAALLSEPSRYQVSTESVQESELLVWNRARMQDLTTRYPRFLQNSLLIASDYMAWYLAAHIGLTCHTARDRFGTVLVALAHNKGARGMELEVTNEELANAAAVTRFTASRLLTEWQRSGAIVKTRGKIVVCHPERLVSSARNVQPTPG